MVKLGRKTTSKAPGASDSRPKATSGPISAPAVSSVRWTPKASPRRSLGDAQRDQGVARGGADALADAIEQDEAGDAAQGAADDQQTEAADGRQGVAGGGDLFCAPPAVGGERGAEAHEARGALVQAVDDAELQRGDVQLVQQVQRQDGGDHLRGDVGEQAGDAEEEDGAADEGPVEARLCGRSGDAREALAEEAVQLCASVRVGGAVAVAPREVLTERGVSPFGRPGAGRPWTP